MYTLQHCVKQIYVKFVLTPKKPPFFSFLLDEGKKNLCFSTVLMYY